MKCVDSECQANAVCRHNKCTCKIGFVEIDGSCESEIYIFLYLLSGLCLNKKNRTEITYNFGVNFILKMDKAFIIFITFLFQKNATPSTAHDLHRVSIINAHVIEDTS